MVHQVTLLGEIVGGAVPRVLLPRHADVRGRDDRILIGQ